MKKWSFYAIPLVFFVIIYLFCIVKLSTYEDFYTDKQGGWYSFESFTTIQYVAFILYKFILNFPLSFFVWFNNDFVFLTTYFFIPNSLVIGYIVKWWFSRRHKANAASSRSV